MRVRLLIFLVLILNLCFSKSIAHFRIGNNDCTYNVYPYSHSLDEFRCINHQNCNFDIYDIILNNKIRDISVGTAIINNAINEISDEYLYKEKITNDFPYKQFWLHMFQNIAPWHHDRDVYGNNIDKTEHTSFNLETIQQESLNNPIFPSKKLSRKINFTCHIYTKKHNTPKYITSCRELDRQGIFWYGGNQENL